MKKFWQDFKKFITRGNIIDMAVGVIVGGAFSAIVTALTNQIIMPLINALLSLISGTEGLEGAITMLRPAYDAAGKLVLANSIYIDWGAFITAILNFLIIAFTLFIILKIAMKSSEYLRKATEAALKGQISKEDKAELKKRGINRKDKEAVALYFEEKKQKECEAKLLEEQKKKEAEEEAKRNTPEYLLKEIRDLLAEQKSAESKKQKAK